MISHDVVRDGLRVIFADVFMRDDIEIRPGLTAEDVPGWDSLKQLEIIMATQAHFGMRFTSKEIDGFETLGDLMEVVSRRAA